MNAHTYVFVHIVMLLYVCACVFIHVCAMLLPMYLHVDIRADKCLL